MRAKLIFENKNKGNLHPSMPSLDEIKNIFDEEINSAVNIYIDDNKSIYYYTYPGSSLTLEIKDLFKEKGWDKFYNIKNIEFCNDGIYHEYIIHPYKDESERITPSFDPESEVPEEEASKASEAEEFIESFIDEAIWNTEYWVRMEPEEWENMDEDDKILFVEETIDDFFEYYSGEFLDDVFHTNCDYIISSIANRLG